MHASDILKVQRESEPLPDVVGLVVETLKFRPAYRVDVLADVPVELKSAIYWLGERGSIESAVALLVEHYGFEEGEAITIRFPTVAEDRAKLAAVIASSSLHRWEAEAVPPAPRLADGGLREPFPSISECD
jgi:hypothetical protein